MDDIFTTACKEAAAKMDAYPDRRALEQLAELPEGRERSAGLAKLAEKPRMELQRCLKEMGEKHESRGRSGNRSRSS